MHEFNARSLRECKGIHPDLFRVVNRVFQISPHDLIITDGLRTIAEQREYVRRGVSKTMKSRHLTGHAVDFVVKIGAKGISWDAKLMTEVANAFKQAAKELAIPIDWGGDWKGSWDKPHIELNRKAYP